PLRGPDAGQKMAAAPDARSDAGAISPLTSPLASAGGSAEKPPASWVTERETTLAKPMVEKWKYLAAQTARQETDRDYTLGFLASRELRSCDCTRVNPGAIVRSLEKREGGAAG